MVDRVAAAEDDRRRGLVACRIGDDVVVEPRGLTPGEQAHREAAAGAVLLEPHARLATVGRDHKRWA